MQMGGGWKEKFFRHLCFFPHGLLCIGYEENGTTKRLQTVQSRCDCKLKRMQIVQLSFLSTLHMIFFFFYDFHLYCYRVFQALFVSSCWVVKTKIEKVSRKTTGSSTCLLQIPVYCKHWHMWIKNLGQKAQQRMLPVFVLNSRQLGNWRTLTQKQ